MKKSPNDQPRRRRQNQHADVEVLYARPTRGRSAATLNSTPPRVTTAAADEDDDEE